MTHSNANHRHLSVWKVLEKKARTQKKSVWKLLEDDQHIYASITERECAKMMMMTLSEWLLCWLARKENNVHTPSSAKKVTDLFI